MTIEGKGCPPLHVFNMPLFPHHFHSLSLTFLCINALMCCHISFLLVAYTLVYFPLSCGVVNRHLDSLLLYQSYISACATVVDKCQVFFMAPVLVISYIKDTYFFFYCMKMKLELMQWEGH